MRPHGSPQSLERRRLNGIALLQSGLTPVEVARKLHVDRRSVRRWRASHDAAGLEGVKARPAPGRPRRLSDAQRRKLEKLLLAGPSAAGFATDLWTCPRIAEVIRRHFRVRYHVDHIGRLLRSMDWSPQKPERVARERDEEQIRRWVRNRWPRVKKTPGR